MTEYVLAAGTDDVTWVDGAGNFWPSLTVIPFGINFASNPYRCGIRWTGITISENAVIDSAYASFYRYNKVGTPPECTVYFEDAANPAAISSNTDGEGRTKTSTSASVTCPSSGEWWNTPSLVSIIQELVDTYDYTAGAAMQMLIVGGGVASNYGSSYSYNQGSQYAPKLTITYHIEEPTITRIAATNRGTATSRIDRVCNRIRLDPTVALSNVGLFYQGNAGIYANIIPHCSEYVSSLGKIFGFYQGSDLRPWAFTYDVATQTTSSPVSIGGSGLSNDSHGAPTMCIDASGYIRVFWGCHTSNIYYRKSTNPYDISAWNTQQSISGDFTYPSIFYYNGYWYLFHRTQSSYPLGWGWNRTNDFSTWSSLTEVIRPNPSGEANDANYTVVRQDPNGNIHMFWCIWNQSTSTISDLRYAYTSDLSTWREADGTAYSSLPIRNNEAEVIITSNLLYAQNSDIGFDNDGHVHIIVNDHYNWKHVSWNGSSWDISTITSKSTGTQHASSHLIIRADDDMTVYLAFSDAATNVLYASIEEYHSTDGGTTWTFRNVIMNYGYRGLFNHVYNGIEGCRMIYAGSTIRSQDISIV